MWYWFSCFGGGNGNLLTRNSQSQKGFFFRILVYGCNPSSCELYTLWLFNIAMENGPFIDGLPIKKVIFHGYVK